MKLQYRGFTLEAHRERSMGGDVLLYYSIFRDSDSYECASGYTFDESPIRVYLNHMKERVDAELESDNPWDENDELE